MLPLQFRRFIYAAGAVALAVAAQASHAQQPPMVGGARDAHGCMASTGYSWCATENACVQPWTLAAKKGFAKGDKAAFSAYCQAGAPAPMMSPPMVGGRRDAHGCMASAGYSWCATENACVQPWTLAAKKGFAKGDKAAFGAYCQ